MKKMIMAGLLAASMLTNVYAASVTHVVEEGQTLAAIAQEYGTTVDKLRELNALEGDTIVVGQELVVKEDDSEGVESKENTDEGKTTGGNDTTSETLKGNTNGEEKGTPEDTTKVEATELPSEIQGVWNYVNDKGTVVRQIQITSNEVKDLTNKVNYSVTGFVKKDNPTGKPTYEISWDVAKFEKDYGKKAESKGNMVIDSIDEGSIKFDNVVYVKDKESKESKEPKEKESKVIGSELPKLLQGKWASKDGVKVQLTTKLIKNLSEGKEYTITSIKASNADKYTQYEVSWDVEKFQKDYNVKVPGPQAITIKHYKEGHITLNGELFVKVVTDATPSKEVDLAKLRKNIINDTDITKEQLDKITDAQLTKLLSEQKGGVPETKELARILKAWYPKVFGVTDGKGKGKEAPKVNVGKDGKKVVIDSNGKKSVLPTTGERSNGILMGLAVIVLIGGVAVLYMDNKKKNKKDGLKH